MGVVYMWQALSEQLSEHFQRSVSCQERQLLQKTQTSQCYCIGEQERFFVKVCPRHHQGQLEGEAQSLQAIRQTQTLIMPEFIHLGHSKSHAFLVTRYHPSKPLDIDSAFVLGQQLAHLHQWGEQKEYGYDSDNYYHNTLQPNSWDKRWAWFFSEQRIGWQLKLCEEKGIVFGDIPSIIRAIYHKLQSHQPKSSFLHGQLHLSNCARSVEGPLSFHSACYWGDRECDLVMTRYRGLFPTSFYQGYQSVYPLRPSYTERQPLYLLYPLLNDCHQLGGTAITHVQRLLDKHQLRAPNALAE